MWAEDRKTLAVSCANGNKHLDSVKGEEPNYLTSLSVTGSSKRTLPHAVEGKLLGLSQKETVIYQRPTCMVVLSLAFRDAVTIGVSLLLLLLRNAKDTVDAVSTGTLGVVVAPRVVLLRLYRRRWSVGDDGHRACLLLLLLLLRRTAAPGLLLLLLVVNMLRLFRRLIPDDPATHHLPRYNVNYEALLFRGDCKLDEK